MQRCKLKHFSIWVVLKLTSWCSGSTATIIRIPSIHGLEETSDFLCKFSFLLLDSYPRNVCFLSISSLSSFDFVFLCFLRFLPPKYLYSIGTTVDVTIWSTVEPGIGIIAGCMVTLRPLLQVIRWRTGLSSSRPASLPLQRPSEARKRQSRFGYHRSYGPEELRPDNVWTVTTATGPQRNWRDRSNSEERMVGGGINKEVVFEYSAEVSGGV